MDQLSLFGSGEGLRFPEELLEYTEGFISPSEASQLLQLLIATTKWEQTSIAIYDKVMLTPRLIAWHGDQHERYTMAGKSIPMSPWTPELLALKEKIEAFSGFQFNSVLLNYYRDGNDSVTWHRDKESELGNRPVIASVSLGQVRSFEFRAVDDHKNKYALPLQNGSLLIMKGDLQVNWEHRIAKSAKQLGPRINLTFRKVKTS